MIPGMKVGQVSSQGRVGRLKCIGLMSVLETKLLPPPTYFHSLFVYPGAVHLASGLMAANGVYLGQWGEGLWPRSCLVSLTGF